ncbi:RNA polymerase sigma-70 factor [Olivibacter sp. SDN3]|uniref:RNA polymerase sigma factor n=1 Tax=Olivibacter sp. SDN3 TaxID=2764720 RepID=UPI00165144B8|nr:RNA polymerase sigma-70 factor [Olivibacter sp. SDN3]QNL47837.1 RNA polymerase sigma-70 factor [Olivibacter sp. SDN3]
MTKMKEIPNMLKRMHEGDTTVLAPIFKYYNQRLLYFAKSLVRDDGVAEEIVADSFVKLWQGRMRIQQQDSIKAFLYIATKNACLNYNKSAHAKQYFDHELDEALLMADPEVYTKILRAEWLQQLHEALQKLPAKQREVFKLSFLEGLTTCEICAELKMSPNAVFANRSRALEALRKVLKEPILLWLIYLLAKLP